MISPYQGSNQQSPPDKGDNRGLVRSFGVDVLSGATPDGYKTEKRNIRTMVRHNPKESLEFQETGANKVLCRLNPLTKWGLIRYIDP